MDMSGVDFIDSLDDKLGLLLTEGHKRHIAVCRAVVRDPATVVSGSSKLQAELFSFVAFEKVRRPTTLFIYHNQSCQCAAGRNR